MPTARPNVTRSLDGRIWFTALQNGISVMDPRHLPFNNVPPPVHIEEITADGKIYWQNSAGVNSPDDASSHLRLPARTRDLEIDYTALSLVVPEKLRFRYKLEGKDDDWRDAGARRKAFYNDLRPRTYRFRVIACNNSSVWNEVGDTLEFSIAPAYYQTTLFQVVCLAVFLALPWGAYRYRVYRLAREFNLRLEGRVVERTRVARDLHDTLLQGFQGTLIEFQAARNLFSRRAENAMQALDDAIRSAESAIEEGRDAIQNLRAGSGDRDDLAHVLRATAKELSGKQVGDSNQPVFRVTVEGPPQALSPMIQDELYGIGREILRNAFRHARARRIEAEVRYDARVFRLRIRDDGIGIGPKVLEQGARPGHWGLPGVRERAKLVGAKLDFWSEAGAGTEVQVTVPAAVAYVKSKDARAFRFFRSHADRR